MNYAKGQEEHSSMKDSVKGAWPRRAAAGEGWAKTAEELIGFEEEDLLQNASLWTKWRSVE